MEKLQRVCVSINRWRPDAIISKTIWQAIRTKNGNKKKNGTNRFIVIPITALRVCANGPKIVQS